MRRLIAVSGLLLVIAILHRQTAAAPLEARATLALALVIAIPLLAAGWLAAYRIPTVAVALGLGLLLGPAWLRFVRADEVAALRLAGDAALGVLAVAAGAALSAVASAGGRPSGKTLLRGVLIPLAVVALVVVAVGPWFPLTRHEPLGDMLGVAVVLGALAVAGAPSLVRAVAFEAGGGAPDARSLILLHVWRDAAAVVLVPAAIALTAFIGSPGATDPAASAYLVRLLAISLATGGVLGLVAARLASRLGAQGNALGLLGLAAAVVASGLGSDPTVTGLAAGVAFGAAASSREDVGLGGWGAPVTAAAFGLVGAGLDFGAVNGLVAWVPLLVGARLAALWWAGRRAAHGEPREHDWPALVPQMGLVVALAATARRAFPEWGVSLEAVVVLMVAVNALVGAVGVRRSLDRAAS